MYLFLLLKVTTFPCIYQQQELRAFCKKKGEKNVMTGVPDASSESVRQEVKCQTFPERTCLRLLGARCVELKVYNYNRVCNMLRTHATENKQTVCKKFQYDKDERHVLHEDDGGRKDARQRGGRRFPVRCRLSFANKSNGCCSSSWLLRSHHWPHASISDHYSVLGAG